MKPYVICHMNASVDGRILGSRWRPAENRMAGLFERLHDKLGLTSVMITHDTLEAVLLADRIAVIRSGRIVACDSPRALMNDATDDYVRELMATPRRQAERLSGLVGRG